MRLPGKDNSNMFIFEEYAGENLIEFGLSE